MQFALINILYGLRSLSAAESNSMQSTSDTTTDDIETCLKPDGQRTDTRWCPSRHHRCSRCTNVQIWHETMWRTLIYVYICQDETSQDVPASRRHARLGLFGWAGNLHCWDACVRAQSAHTHICMYTQNPLRAPSVWLLMWPPNGREEFDFVWCVLVCIHYERTRVMLYEQIVFKRRTRIFRGE